jgi:D-alanyl-D-alanine carboxypeptidase-like protein
VSEYDIPGLTAAAPAFTGTADSAEAAARAIIRLRAKQHGSKARLPVDLTGLDARLRAWAGEVGRSADLLRAGTNGRLPDSALTGVGDGRRMYTPAARAFGSMDAAARAAGHDLHVNSGYRTYGEQAALYQAYRNGTGNLAAAPGRSTHGLGLSADIRVTDPATLRWLRANAARYGFVNDVPSEAWHWTWRP